MVFKEYTNRFGKKMILDDFMLQCFLLMKDKLSGAGIDIEMTDGWRGQADQDAAKASGDRKSVV